MDSVDYGTMAKYTWERFLFWHACTGDPESPWTACSVCVERMLDCLACLISLSLSSRPAGVQNQILGVPYRSGTHTLSLVIRAPIQFNTHLADSSTLIQLVPRLVPCGASSSSSTCSTHREDVNKNTNSRTRTAAAAASACTANVQTMLQSVSLRQYRWRTLSGDNSS